MSLNDRMSIVEDKIVTLEKMIMDIMKNTMTKQTYFTYPHVLSDELAELLDKDKGTIMTPQEVNRLVEHYYIHKLQDHPGRGKIQDDKLRRITKSERPIVGTYILCRYGGIIYDHLTPCLHPKT